MATASCSESFQLSLDDMLQMHRELHQQRQAMLAAVQSYGARRQATLMRQELQQASASLEFLLAECDRLRSENHQLRG